MNITDARREKCRQSPLVPSEKIFLPHLHIKLGLMKNFVKNMAESGRGFEYLVNKFPNVSESKIKKIYL